MGLMSAAGFGSQHAVQPLVESAADESNHLSRLFQSQTGTAPAQHHSAVPWKGEAGNHHDLLCKTGSIALRQTMWLCAL